MCERVCVFFLLCKFLRLNLIYWVCSNVLSYFVGFELVGVLKVLFIFSDLLEEM